MRSIYSHTSWIAVSAPYLYPPACTGINGRHQRNTHETLHVSIDELIGEQTQPKAGKRGPAPKIQQQLERVSTLPKPDQRAVMRVLDSMLAQARR